MTTGSEDDLDEMRRNHPDWEIHVSGAGRYWALTRSRAFTPESQMRAYVDADTLDELDEVLIEQERLRKQVVAVPFPRPVQDTA